MEDEIYEEDHILSNDISQDGSGLYLNGGSDVPDGESFSSLGGDETDNGSSINGSVSGKTGSIMSEDTAVDGVAVFEDHGEDDSLSAPHCCAECGMANGTFLECRGCGLLYHRKCILQCFLPSGPDVWRCPQCQWKMISTGEVPLDQSLGPGEMSDGSHSGYDLTTSPLEHDELLDEVFDIGKGQRRRRLRSSSASPVREFPPNHGEKKRKKPVSEGTNFQNRINVGYGYQVPFTPAFFLDESSNDQDDSNDWARMVYSPYNLEKIRARRIKDGSLESVINDEFELAEYMQLCAQSWKNNPGWHPFSPEFAYKILHYADYDPKKALRVMNDPNFNFVNVCDPPTRRYENKWKPKDRRGQVPTNPYPPPVTLRGYLLRRHDAAK